MDTSKILTILCCFILIVCLTLCISTLTVLRNAVDESRTLQETASQTVAEFDRLVGVFLENSIPVSGNPDEGDSTAVFYLRESNGNIGIYSADGYLIKLLEISIDTLPAADRTALQNGIPLASWRELLQILDDYTT